MIRLFSAALGVDLEPGAQREGGLPRAFAGGGEVVGIGDLCLCERIELHLGLRAGSADGDAAAIGQLGENKLLGRNAFAFRIEHLVALVIRDADDLGAVDDGRRRGAPGGDDAADAGGALGAFERKVQEILVVGSVAEVQHIERVEERAAARAEQRGELAEHDHRGVSILVADGVVREVAVAFLGAE